MGFLEKFAEASARNRSLLCVGLDMDVRRLPEGFPKDAEGVLAYGREVVAATQDLCAAYKPNTAFFEVLGSEGWSALERLVASVPSWMPVILDAKRADIGNTSERYAEAVFDRLGADAVTVAPYMGYDSLEPFLRRTDRHVFVLVLTSNPGAADFETLDCGGRPLYLRVAERLREWNTAGNIGVVAGATRPEEMLLLRRVLPDEVFLVPGLGAQGGALEESVRNALAGNGRALFNVSRDIVFAGSPERVRRKAEEYRRAIEGARQAS